MKAKVRTLDGDVAEEIDLPAVFDSEYRPDLIKKDVLAIQSGRLQPHGTFVYAGNLSSADSWGSGRGVAHVPRLKNGSRAARVPQAKGGREAHPPKVEKVLVEKINKKEKRKALQSAIAATSVEEIVRLRGHQFDAELPLVLADDLEEVQKTGEIIDILNALGVYGDVERSKESRN
ncbi:MAG TPA: 50S ribosomal protein L4, partial [Methanomicrobiales archaeon]|nr:50S ribosomal protein L4 [Methanomicrobiales archaeon]